MPEPIRALSVHELLRKADPVTAAKLTVIRCLNSYEGGEDINWALDKLVTGIRDVIPEVEVADVYLSTYRLLANVTNDPDDERFDPKDQFPAVLEPIMHADILLVGACECCGIPHSNVVRVVERLSGYAAELAKRTEKPQSLLFRRVPCGVVVVGGHGASQAASMLGTALNRLGCTLPAGGIAFYDGTKGRVFKSDDFAATLGGVATNLADLVGQAGDRSIE